MSTAKPSPNPQAARLGSLPHGSSEELRFVQDRVAMLGKVTFFISAMFLIVVAAADYARHVHRVELLGRASHATGTLVALGLWRWLRQRRLLSPEAIGRLDLAGTLCICLSFVGMGRYAMQPYGYYTAMLAVTHVSISRAMIVPSAPRRTLLLALASFAGLVLIRATMPLNHEAIVMGGRARGIVEAGLWSTAGIAVSTLASTVIYGLQRRAREARELGQYTLEEKIGEGGMGEIYRASHAMLRRATAIKLLLGDSSEAQLKRFEKEVQLTASLTHPNTISIYDYGRTHDGVFYYVMELLDGMTLADLVERHGPLPPGRVIHVLLQVCGALQEAHKRGLIHRDVKPDNIFLCRRGDLVDFVKVLDFGLVREVESSEAVSKSTSNLVVGTPLYMSPEAILEPERVDALADIYGLGAVAYFLVTGQTPFHGKTVVEICVHHLHSTPPPPSNHRPVPPNLERLILRCLEKEKAARPQSAKSLASDLRACAAANAWSETDAEAWWATQASPAAPHPAPSNSTSPTRRTIIAADLSQRLER